MSKSNGDAVLHDTGAPADRSRSSEDQPINWLRELRGLVLMLLAVLCFHSFLAKPFYIPSISMMPNLLVGDRLVVSKYPFGWNWSSISFHLLPRGTWRIAGKTPDYGDIVIVVPRNRKEDLIKRVIGRPGDRVAVVNGQIVLNGRRVPQAVEPSVQLPVEDSLLCDNGGYRDACLAPFERYRTRLPSGREVYELPAYRETLPNGASYTVIDHLDQMLDHYPEVTVPEGHVFLMGDNRDHSADSRASLEENGLGGPVPLSDIGGRAEIVTFSLDGSQSWNPLTWLRALRGGRAGTSWRPPLDRPTSTSPRHSAA